MNKLYSTPERALEGLLKDGLTIMAGGFGLCGIPEKLIKAIFDSKVKNLTIISNNCGTDDYGLGILLKNGQIKKMISSYVGENKNFELAYLKGTLELELNPQGTLCRTYQGRGFRNCCILY